MTYYLKYTWHYGTVNIIETRIEEDYIEECCIYEKTTIDDCTRERWYSHEENGWASISLRFFVGDVVHGDTVDVLTEDEVFLLKL